MKHTVKMILGCVLPLLLIFIFPIFGFGDGIKLFLVIVAMFVCHYYMLGGHHDQFETRQTLQQQRQSHQLQLQLKLSPCSRDTGNPIPLNQ